MTKRITFCEETRTKVLLKTDSLCHICHKKLARKNYGAIGTRGAWEIDHSIPVSKGGTNHINNLYPACISCNRSKGNRSNAQARLPFGKDVAPLSKERKESDRKKSIATGAAIGAGLGILLGPAGMFFGSCLGALIGSEE